MVNRDEIAKKFSKILVDYSFRSGKPFDIGKATDLMIDWFLANKKEIDVATLDRIIKEASS